MKNNFLVVIGISLFFLFGCEERQLVPNSTNIQTIVNSINESSDFGDWNLFEILESPTKTYDQEYPERAQKYDDNGEIELEGTYYLYSSDSNQQHLTFICIFSKKYNIYNITIGDTLTQANNTFLQQGFTRDDETKEKYKTEFYYFVNGDCVITIKTDETLEQKITLLQIGIVDSSDEIGAY